MRFLYPILLIIGLGFVFMIPTTDTDFGWHLRCGQQFWENGQLCFQNGYSYFLADYYWGYSTFFYDLILALVYNYAGFRGVAVSLGVLIAFLVSFYYLYFNKSNTLWLSLLNFFFFGSSVIRIGFRPQVMSYLFFLLSLLLIDQLFEQKKGLKFYFHVFYYGLLIIWVNTHPSFILAVTLYSFYCILNIIMRRVYFFLPLFLIFLVPLVNPVGIKVYIELFNHYTSNLSELIAEWAAPNFIFQFTIIITLLLTIRTLWQTRRNWTETTYFYIGTLIFLVIISLSAKRHVPLYGVYLAFFWEKIQLLKIYISRFKLPLRLLNYCLLFLIIFFSLDSWQKLSEIKNFQNWYCKNALVRLPCRAAKALKNYEGNIFTMYEWGGFMIWQMPRAKVFVDGRMPAWQTRSGKSPYTIYLEIIQALPGWQQTLAKYQTKAVLVQPGTFLDLELKANSNSNWILTKKLGNAVLYEHRK